MDEPTPAIRALYAWKDKHLEFAAGRAVLNRACGSSPAFPEGFHHTVTELRTKTFTSTERYLLFWTREVENTYTTKVDLHLKKHNFGWAGQLHINGKRTAHFQYLKHGDRLKFDGDSEQWMPICMEMVTEFFEPKQKGSPDEPESPEEPEGSRP